MLNMIVNAFEETFFSKINNSDFIFQKMNCLLRKQTYFFCPLGRKANIQEW